MNLTQADLDANPILVDAGYVVGDILPTKEQADATGGDPTQPGTGPGYPPPPPPKS